MTSCQINIFLREVVRENPCHQMTRLVIEGSGFDPRYGRRTPRPMSYCQQVFSRRHIPGSLNLERSFLNHGTPFVCSTLASLWNQTDFLAVLFVITR